MCLWWDREETGAPSLGLAESRRGQEFGGPGATGAPPLVLRTSNRQWQKERGTFDTFLLVESE